MHKVWLIAWREYRERVTKAPFLFSTGMVLVALLLIPLIPLLLGQGRHAGPAKILIADGTGGPAFRALQAGLAAIAGEESAGAPGVPGVAAAGGAAPGPSVAGGTPLGPKLQVEAVPPGDIAAAEARVKQGKAAGLLVLQGSWPGDLKAEYRTATLFALEHRPTLAAALTRAAQAQRAQQSGLDAAALQRVLAPVKVDEVNLASGDRDRTAEGMRIGLATAAGALVYFGILVTGAMLFQGVMEEKTSRVVEVLAASVRPVQMMAGKILGLGLLGLTQYASWLLGWLYLLTVGYALLGDMVKMATPAFMAYLLLFTVLGYMLYAALFAAAGAMISRMEDSSAVMTPIILPLVVPMMLNTFITQNPEGTLGRVLSFIPLFTPSIMLNRIVSGRPAAWEIVLSVLLLVGSIPLVTWMAGRIYRAGILTYGSRPTLAQLWRYLHS